MPGRRRARDTIGGKAEAGCAKCCAYCRLSPLGSAVCYSGVIIGILTAILYLFGAGLSSAAEPEKGEPNGKCSNENVNIKIGDGSIDSLYISYLKFTGFIVFFVILAVISSCCICCGLFCGLPKQCKICSAFCIIPTAICFGLFIGWLALGTYLVQIMGSDLRNNTICRNIQTYIVVMYIYLLCLLIFGLIVSIWKIHNVYKGDDGKTPPRTRGVDPSAGGGGGLIGKASGGVMGIV